MILAYLLSAFSFIAGIGLNVTSGWLITMASFAPPVLTLSVAVVLVRFFGISRSITRYLERITSHKAVFSKLAEIRSELFSRVASNASQLLFPGKSGSLIKQIVDDVERTQEYELRVILPGAAAFISMIAATLLALWLQPQLGLLWLLLTFFLFFLIPRMAIRKMSVSTKEIETLESRYADQIRSTTHGSLEAEIYGYLSEIQSTSHEIENKLAECEIGLLKIIRNFQVVINLIIGSTLILTFYYVDAHSMPAVQVAMLVFLSLTGFESVLAWYPNLFTSGKLRLAKEKLANIRGNKPEPKVSVKFDSLQAQSYSAFWNQPVTSPLDFNLSCGNVLVLRGVSGVGKTTTAMGIFGLVKYVGSLKIGGVEVNEIENLSELAAGALQNGHIFNTSLRENLKISGSQDFDEVLELLELTELVSEMPEGIDTIIGEYGRGISGGEAKRIILARALLSPAPLLVLDEPTEHLDPELAERITQRILHKYSDRALLVITHSGWSGVPQLNLERLTHEN